MSLKPRCTGETKSADLGLGLAGAAFWAAVFNEIKSRLVVQGIRRDRLNVGPEYALVNGFWRFAGFGGHIVNRVVGSCGELHTQIIGKM